ncbi:MAG: 4Fe-4S dicluster domain-containing protein, partial [Gammaproteobacteria bacterium]
MSEIEPALFAHLITDAERCVKCALCLPYCPTYGLTHEEGDSPRGRIALIQALAEGSLEPSSVARAHLEGCLSCRACEAVCPAGVPYGRLLDNARAEL